MTSRVVWSSTSHSDRRREWHCGWNWRIHENPSPRHQPLPAKQGLELLLAEIRRDQLTAITTIYAKINFHGPHWNAGELAAISWLSTALRQHIIVGFEVFPAMKGDALNQYAITHGINLGTALPVSALVPVSLPNPPANLPIAVFKGADSDQALATEFSDTCPAMNYRSESVKTAHPDVITWLGKNINKAYRWKKPGKDAWEGTLGHEGGGGFLAGTTRVVKIPAGTPLFRYATINGHKGGWWFPQPMAGDPRVFAALPDDSPAPYLFSAVTTKEIEILTGLGAPRCSNKPGGPIQYYVAYSDQMHIDMLMTKQLAS